MEQFSIILTGAFTGSAQAESIAKQIRSHAEAIAARRFDVRLAKFHDVGAEPERASSPSDVSLAEGHEMEARDTDREFAGQRWKDSSDGSIVAGDFVFREIVAKANVTHRDAVRWMRGSGVSTTSISRWMRTA